MAADPSTDQYKAGTKLPEAFTMLKFSKQAGS